MSYLNLLNDDTLRQWIGVRRKYIVLQIQAHLSIDVIYVCIRRGLFNSRNIYSDIVRAKMDYSYY